MVQRSSTSEHIMNTTISIWIGKKPPAPRKGVLMRSCISIILLSKQSPACWLFPGQGRIHEPYFVTRWRHIRQNRLVFRRKEVTGMCTAEPKEPVPMPGAFNSFVKAEKNIYQNDKSKIPWQVSGYRTQRYQFSLWPKILWTTPGTTDRGCSRSRTTFGDRELCLTWQPHQDRPIRDVQCLLTPPP